MFNTDKKKQDAISSFANLLNSDGWKLIVEILDENIGILRERLESGSEGETLSDVKRLRDKLESMTEMRDTPQNMIKKLEAPISEPANPDPFDTIKDVQDRKKESVDKEVEE